ncbi:hypothetical protein [Marivivens aquimaris]|uniref:hypothetical protein n=1 Tax=Marivivens aquimaris TaxID=2774876 RepID=UPI001D16C64A|nr:hypothetical protein [Marivivens aquimaris]
MSSRSGITPRNSIATMSRRHEALDSLDDFPTPPWATRAVIDHLKRRGVPVGGVVAEPCANRGYMVRPLWEAFDTVIASDVHDYGMGYEVRDYLDGKPKPPVDWTFINPPFNEALAFIQEALLTSTVGVAAFLRLSFLETQERYRDLYAANAPSRVIIHSDRVVIHKGRVPSPNVKEAVIDPKTGQTVMRAPTTATAYCWLIFERGNTRHTTLEWLPPSRRLFEQPDDYTPHGEQ